MGAELKGTINIDADFSQADKKLKDFVKGMEDKATYKKSSVNRMTQPFLKSHFEKWIKADSTQLKNLKTFFGSKDVKDRMIGYLTAKAKRGDFGEGYSKLTKEQKQSFIEDKYKDLKNYIVSSESDRIKGKKKQQDLINKAEILNQKKKAQNIAAEKSFEIKRNILHSKALKENQKRDEALRKKQWNLLLGKWGKLGIGGMIAAQAIRYISRGASAINQVAQTALGHQMTIEGGASGAGFFGTGLAAMQRAGISAKEYGSWKRNMMGQVGALKLGMGNAAPFMSLGVSVLDNLDNMELQIEKRLQSLPAETSWALGSQLGMSYELWERMYKGEIDRSKPGYDEDALKEWAKAAKNINELITDIKVFFVNFFGKPASLITSLSGWKDAALQTVAASSIPLALGGNPLRLAISVKKDGNLTVDAQDLNRQNVDTWLEFIDGNNQ